MKKALVIIGHGSRAAKAQEIFNAMVSMVRDKGEFPIVEGAHMELCKPSIPEVVERIVKDGVTEVIMVPYFLYEGIHIEEDIPQIIETLTDKFHDVTFKMGRPIGAEPLLSEILLKRAIEVR